MIIACNIISVPIINQLHIARHQACHHHIHPDQTDVCDDHDIHNQTDDDHDTSNTCCPFCLQLHALNNTIIIEAVQSFPLNFLQCLEFIHIAYDDLIQFPFVIITNQRSPPFV